MSFVTLGVVDAEDRFVPHATPTVTFTIDGPGLIVATVNGDPTDRQVFPSIVRALPSQTGEITVAAKHDRLASASVTIQSN